MTGKNGGDQTTANGLKERNWAAWSVKYRDKMRRTRKSASS